MPYREEMPVEKGMDHTLSFLLEGYKYISNRTEKYNRNIFRTRMLGGQQVICLVGKEAAELFYDNEKFKRHGAAPQRVLKTLFGQGGVQTLDGTKHHHRKDLFMSLMTGERLQEVSRIFRQKWLQAMDEWEMLDEVVLYDEVKKVLTRTACEWAGVPLSGNEIQKREDQLSAMFEGGGAVGARYIHGKQGRKQAEQWIAGMIKEVRSGGLKASHDSVLYRFAMFEDEGGNLLDERIAAVELINILRPIVAVSVYIAFCALALHSFPAEKKKLAAGEDHALEMFIEEVRRFYPFFPMAVAKVKKDFLWKGFDFKKETMVLLDLYGTNHDASLWEKPDTFWPDRFRDRKEDLYDFIPQGGGDYYQGHRCPGEWLTVDLMKTATDLLANHMTYTVPEQDLKYSMNRMPSLPKSRFIIEKVRRTHQEDSPHG